MNNDGPINAAAASSNGQESQPGSSMESGERVTTTVPSEERKKLQEEKRNVLLGSLLENLDSLIYLELCILYYMDNSLFRLLIRAINQLMFLTPKPAFVPPAPPYRPYLGAIFAPNIICILLHILTARSEAGEVTRGYLHGGVIVDLIGQKGPTGKTHLVLLDLLVWILQCVMLTAIMEKEKIVKAVNDLKIGPRLEDATDSVQQSDFSAVLPEDLDAEERGVTRHTTETDDIELNYFNPPAPILERGRQNEERCQLLREPRYAQQQNESESPLDMFYSTTALLTTLYVFPALRTQWEDYGNASGSALQTVGFSAEFARVAATRRLNAESRSLQRPLNG